MTIGLARCMGLAIVRLGVDASLRALLVACRAGRASESTARSSRCTWPEVERDGAGRSEMERDGARFSQVERGGARWSEMAVARMAWRRHGTGMAQAWRRHGAGIGQAWCVRARACPETEK